MILFYRQGSHPQDIIFKPEEQIFQSKEKHKMLKNIQTKSNFKPTLQLNRIEI